MYKGRSTDGALRYVCYRNGCKARIVVNTDNMTCSMVPKYESHNHDDDQEAFYKQCKTEANIKMRCRADKKTSLQEIFKSEPGTSEMSYKKMRSTMVNNRLKSSPANPTSKDTAAIFFEEDEIKSMFTSDETDMILQQFVSTEHYSFVIFASPSILDTMPDIRLFHITSSMKVIADGFFKVLLTVAVIKDAKVRLSPTRNVLLSDSPLIKNFFQSFPCIYVMLSERDKIAYKHALQIIEEKFHLQISKAWIDYDLALRNAIASIYPSVVMAAFWYQFCYAIRRKCKLIEQFYENVYLSNASHLFHQVLCLPLLPQSQVSEGIAIMKRKCGIFPPLSDMLSRIDELLSREGVHNFCIDWAWFGENCTQNFNETLKKKNSVANSSSSLFDLLKLLKSEQSKINMDYESEGQTSTKDEVQNSTIKKFREDLNNGRIDVGLFLSRCTFKDNTGSVKDMDYYHENDENDYMGDSDAYEQQERNNQPQAEPVNNIIADFVESDLCIVCYGNRRDVLLEPCFHLKFCLSCIETIHERQPSQSNVQAATPKCPLCRTPIQTYRRVYL